jgi:hypothetical protein
VNGIEGHLQFESSFESPFCLTARTTDPCGDSVST